MRIQHNISAMNTLSSYRTNNNALASNLEKLSSGYRINSAADDAAGLAISEKMRSQIAGLEQAQNNCNDGISLVQTAEGALTEVNSMLTRLTTLATESANGTYDDEVSRTNIQEEVDAILDEIDRISQSTNFNGINLLDGSLSGASQVDNVAIDTSNAVKGTYTTLNAIADSATLVNGTAEESLTVDDIGKTIDYTVTWKTADGTEKTTTVSLTFQGNGEGQVDLGTIENNYFTDEQGNKVSLEDSGELSAESLQNSILAGLKGDEEFNSAFSVELNSDEQLVFTARADGTEGASVVSTGVSSDLAIDPTGDDGTDIGGDGSAIVTKAVDSMQMIDVTKLTIADADTTTEDEINEAIFEIDGNKFLLVDNASNAFTATQLKALDDDVNVIEVDASDVTSSLDKISAEISRVTGLATKTGAEVATMVGGDTTDAFVATGISATNNIVFTEDTLKLDGTELSLQVGDTNASYQKVTVAIQDMSSSGLGLTGLDLSTQEKAGEAVDTINAAINLVSLQRGQLGATQNRLDHTLNNLDATTTNLSDSESQIRDVDMAEEMTEYSKNSILAQAAQSMLAQANSLPQGVLQLLQ